MKWNKHVLEFSIIQSTKSESISRFDQSTVFTALFDTGKKVVYFCLLYILNNFGAISHNYITAEQRGFNVEKIESDDVRVVSK